MMINSRWGFVILLAWLCSCENISPKTNNISPYFPIDSLISNQFSNQSWPVTVQKLIKIDSESDSAEVIMDSIAYQKELNILRELDLNKPDLVGVYEENRSGNKIIYTKRPSQRTGNVQRLEIEEINDIVIVKALTEESNSLYQSKRNYQLTFAGGNLSAYHISGFQKILLKEASTFEVTGKILTQ